MSLTETKIKNAKPTERMYRLPDGDGLFLQVTPKGAKYWRFRYFYAGKEKMLAMGTYPEVSLAEAREKRTMARKDVAAGIDPSAKKQQEKKLAVFKANNTLEAVAKEWHEKNKAKWSEDHGERIWQRLKPNVLKPLGNRPISEIEPLELLDVLQKVEERGATDLSRRLLQTCTQIFRYAIVTKRATYNPAADLRGALKPHKSENYPRIDAKEIPVFLNKLGTVGTSDQNRLAIRLMMLTFVRTIELRRAKWTDVDLKAREWRLPANTTKTKKVHIVPLAKQSLEILGELRKLTGGKELMFPPQMHCRHMMMSENTINNVLKKMGYKGKMVGHGFRGLASTTLNEMGYAPDVIERQLAHKDTNQVRAAYNHAQYLPQRRAMMQDWADFVEKMTLNGTVIVADFKNNAAGGQQ